MNHLSKLIVLGGALVLAACDSSDNDPAPVEPVPSTTVQVLHASPEWSGERMDEEPAQVLPKLEAAFWDATQLGVHEPQYSVCHRWRYAIPPEPLESRYLFDPHCVVGACGDWCNGPRVEGAFLSGLALGQRILAQLSKTKSQ